MVHRSNTIFAGQNCSLRVEPRPTQQVFNDAVRDLRRCQMIARAKYIGRRLCDPPKDESEHFIHEGPLPHPEHDQPQ